MLKASTLLLGLVLLCAPSVLLAQNVLLPDSSTSSTPSPTTTTTTTDPSQTSTSNTTSSSSSSVSATTTSTPDQTTTSSSTSAPPPTTAAITSGGSASSLTTTSNGGVIPQVYLTATYQNQLIAQEQSNIGSLNGALATIQQNGLPKGSSPSSYAQVQTMCVNICNNIAESQYRLSQLQSGPVLSYSVPTLYQYQVSDCQYSAPPKNSNTNGCCCPETNGGSCQ